MSAFSEFSSTCPACRQEGSVDELEDRGIPFLGCTGCYGLFVTEDGLQAYVADSTGNEDIGKCFPELLQASLEQKKPSSGKRPCPVCKEPLGRLGFGESPFVILDRCADHGVWMDKKELKKIIRSCRADATVKGLVRPTDIQDEED